MRTPDAILSKCGMGAPPMRLSPRAAHGWGARATGMAVLLLSLVCCVGSAEGEDSLLILPNHLALQGPTARQAVIVERMRDGQAVGQFRENLSLTSDNDKVVRIENGVAIPVANGTTVLTAKQGDRTATAQVTVTATDTPWHWSFRNDVQPVLTKVGCNSGACHGAAAGKNGFHLSLRGYDDEGDFRTLTRQFLTRRVNPSDPAHSLMLMKPTLAIAHKGGERFKTDSMEYRILSGWIAQGTPPPASDDPRIVNIELVPEHVILKPGDDQQLLVLAHFSDGSAREVTHFAKFTATDTSVGTVNDEGLVKIAGHGEGAVTAWYLSKIAVATVTSPHDNRIDADQYAAGSNLIDRLDTEKLKDLQLPPSPIASDSEFLRRAFVDTIGVLPTADEARKFMADQSSDKRDKLIDELLYRRPEFVDYWSYKWSDLLLVSSRKLQPEQMWSYYHWVRDRVAANTPWDQFARQLVTATGSARENGAANFFVLHDDPADISENLSVAMLGFSINCAKCHNHPMEKWTNDQYYAMANLFARVRTKAGPDGQPVVFEGSDGDVIQPLTGKPQPPRPLDAAAVAPEEDRRVGFADWLTSPGNPYFARAIVNRVWASFMGVGLVEKVDDMRATNPPSNEKLLSALAGYLVEHHYDLKELMKLILQSQTYQRSSQTLAGNAADTKFYSHHYPRRIMAEVLLDATSQVTQAQTSFPNYPEGWRAVQLPDSNVDSYFLKSFGRPERVLTCECERTAEPSMAQAMHIANGDTVNQKLAAKGNVIDKLVAAHASDEQIIEDAYLAALSRYPTDKEKRQIRDVLQDATGADRRKLLEDFYWGLLSSNEFLFDH